LFRVFRFDPHEKASKPRRLSPERPEPLVRQGSCDSLEQSDYGSSDSFDIGTITPPSSTSEYVSSSSEYLSPSNEYVSPSSEYQIITPIYPSPVAEDFLVDDLDAPYFTFFVNKMGKSFGYSEYFPDFVPDLLARAVYNIALRHPILFSSAFVLDAVRRKPLVRFYTHRQVALSILQRSLADGVLDEGTALAVFLFAWIDGATGRLAGSAQNHLRGLTGICKVLREQQGELSPLLQLALKFVLRMDFWFAHFRATLPTLPPVTSDEMFAPQSWTSAADSRAAQWASASFILDALRHKIAHVSILAEADRVANGDLTPDMLFQILDVEIELDRWQQLPIISRAESFEKQAQLEPADPSAPRFLHYDRMRIHDREYCTLF
jgi:hypothetical protein